MASEELKIDIAESANTPEITISKETNEGEDEFFDAVNSNKESSPDQTDPQSSSPNSHEVSTNEQSNSATGDINAVEDILVQSVSDCIIQGNIPTDVQSDKQANINSDTQLDETNLLKHPTESSDMNETNSSNKQENENVASKNLSLEESKSSDCSKKESDGSQQALNTETSDSHDIQNSENNTDDIQKSENNDDDIQKSENNDDDIQKPENNDDDIQKPENNDDDIQNSENNTDDIQKPENNDDDIQKTENNDDDIQKSENNTDDIQNSENNDDIQKSENKDNVNEEGEEEQYTSDEEDIQLPGRRDRGEYSGEDSCSESAGFEQEKEEESEKEDSEDDAESEDDNFFKSGNSEEHQSEENDNIVDTGDEIQKSENKEADSDQIDPDNDKQNPAYVPRTGRYYMHDSRGNEEEDDTDKDLKEKETRRGINADRWQNDLFVRTEQGPVTPRNMGQTQRRDRGGNSNPRNRGSGGNNYGRRYDRETGTSNQFRTQNSSRMPNRNLQFEDKANEYEPHAMLNRQSNSTTDNIRVPKPSSSRGGRGRPFNPPRTTKNDIPKQEGFNEPSDIRHSPRGRGRGPYSNNNRGGNPLGQRTPQKATRQNYEMTGEQEEDYRRPARPNYNNYHAQKDSSSEGRPYNRQTTEESNRGRGRGRGRRARNPSPTGDPVKDMQAQRITEPGERIQSLVSSIAPEEYNNDPPPPRSEGNIRYNQPSKQSKPTYSLEFKNSKLRDPNSKFKNDRRFVEETPPRFSQTRNRAYPDEHQNVRKQIPDSYNNPPKRYSETRPEQPGLRAIRPQTYQNIEEQGAATRTAHPATNVQQPNYFLQENDTAPPASAGTIQQQQSPIKPISLMPNPNLPAAMCDPMVLQQQLMNFVQQITQTQAAAVGETPVFPNPGGGGVFYYPPNTAPVMPAPGVQHMQKRLRTPLEVKNPNEP